MSSDVLRPEGSGPARPEKILLWAAMIGVYKTVAQVAPTAEGFIGYAGRRLLSPLSKKRLERVLGYLLDENEFLSPYGIRSLSRYHQDHPFVFHVGHDAYRVSYLPAESNTGMFGGNSNWRGPVWMPVNTLIIRGLYNLYAFYGDDFTVECPTGSGHRMTLFDVAHDFPSLEPPGYLVALSPQVYEEERARVAGRFEEAVRLAELLQAPVIDNRSRMNMPNTHYLCQSERAATLVAQADCILSLEPVDLFGQLNTLRDQIERTEAGNELSAGRIRSQIDFVIPRTFVGHADALVRNRPRNLQSPAARRGWVGRRPYVWRLRVGRSCILPNGGRRRSRSACNEIHPKSVWRLQN